MSKNYKKLKRAKNSFDHLEVRAVPKSWSKFTANSFRGKNVRTKIQVLTVLINGALHFNKI